MKHIPSTSASNLNDYLERENDGNDLPRVVYEWGQHCRPETAKAEFRALREEHGAQGAVRTVAARYVKPRDPAEATHLKVGKNWRAAKAGEAATHQRIEPKEPLAKRAEAYHYIISFSLEDVNPEDPEQTRKAFDAVVAMWERDYSGVQSKLVAHGDARGSKNAQERGEKGKFHVHIMANAVIHTEMEVDGRVFKPGMRVAGPLTQVDQMRTRHDAFLEERGHEFELGPQRLPAPGSDEARAVRRTDHDFYERERGKLSDQEAAGSAIEAAFVKFNDGQLAGVAPADRKRRLVDEIKAGSGLIMKVRTTKAGDVKLRSWDVEGRKKPIGRTELGERYTDAGIDEQLELLAQGKWKPNKRFQAGPSRPIRKLPETELAELQLEVNTLAQGELQAQAADQSELRIRRAMFDPELLMVLEHYQVRGDLVRAHAEVEQRFGADRAEAYRDFFNKMTPGDVDEARIRADIRAGADTRRPEPMRRQQSQSEMIRAIVLEQQEKLDAASAERTAEYEKKRIQTQSEPVSIERVELVAPEPGTPAEPVRELPADRSRQASEATQKPAASAPQVRADAGAIPAPAKTVPAKPVQPAKRRERKVGVLNRQQMNDAELVAVVMSERADGGAYIDFQLAAGDPAAVRQPGLHLHAKSVERVDKQGGDTRKVTVTWRQLSAPQYERFKAAGGDNFVEIGGRRVYGIAGDITYTTKGEYNANPNTLHSSCLARVGTDVLAEQRASEDRAREMQKDIPSPAEQVFTKATEAQNHVRGGHGLGG